LERDDVFQGFVALTHLQTAAQYLKHGVILFLLVCALVWLIYEMVQLPKRHREKLRSIDERFSGSLSRAPLNRP
jgi:hypothetical protein